VGSCGSGWLNPGTYRVGAQTGDAFHAANPFSRAPDHLIEGVTLERLGREQDLDRRTIRKRIKRAIQRLREAERDLP
jgi:hypothetical protein